MALALGIFSILDSNEKGFKSVLPMNIKKIEDNHYKIGNIHIKDKLPFTEIYEIFR